MSRLAHLGYLIIFIIFFGVFLEYTGGVYFPAVQEEYWDKEDYDNVWSHLENANPEDAQDILLRAYVIDQLRSIIVFKDIWREYEIGEQTYFPVLYKDLVLLRIASLMLQSNVGDADRVSMEKLIYENIDSSDMDVQAMAVFCLGELGENEDVLVLEEKLKSPDVVISLNAVLALKKIVSERKAGRMLAEQFLMSARKNKKLAKIVKKELQ